MLRSKITLAFILFIPVVVLAQKRFPGSIITKSGDTLSVFILKSARYTNKDKVSYTQYIASKEIKFFSPEDVSMFYSEQGYVQSMKDSTGSPSFFKRLSYGGSAVLFVAEDELGYPTYYVQKENGLNIVPRKHMVAALKKILPACSRLRYGGSVYESYYLQNVVSCYNACVDPENATFQKHSRHPVGNAGFKAGPSYNTVKHLGKSFTAIGYSAGVFGEISFTGMSFQLELNYIKRGGAGNGIYANGAYVQIPFILEMNFPVDRQKNVNGYLQLGLTTNRGSANETSYQTVGKSTYLFRTLKGAGGTLLGIGLAKDYRFGKAYFFELRIENISHATETGPFFGDPKKIATLQFSAGFNF